MKFVIVSVLLLCHACILSHAFEGSGQDLDRMLMKKFEGLPGLGYGSRFVASHSNAMNKSSSQAAILKRYDNIRKSHSDKREYRGLELSNGMKLILISDPTAEKCAASLDVNIGHLMDPKDLPGLAHFCEHMLFLGTKKYPEENSYASFISKSGGSSNAYTGAEDTNYHFDAQSQFLQEAMDRFTQFFLTPLFTESATEREVNAVNSEHTNNVQNDAWRAMQLERVLSRPGHDYGKFGTGNYDTLMQLPLLKGVNTRDELLKFHEKYYSSNIMACAILGKESLDELEQLALNMNFGDIANKNFKPKVWKEHAYEPDQLGYRVDVVPVKDIRQLNMVFVVDDLKHLYKYQPGSYVSHLIGHEGKGSLLSELKRRGWATGLSAGPRTVARNIGFFDIQIELSEEGLKHVDEVVELVFYGIGTVSAPGPQKWIQDEISGLGEIRFRFMDKQQPLPYVTNLANALQDIPFEDILSHGSLVEKYDPELIEKLLKQLTPDNMNYYVVAKKAAEGGNLTKEQYYGTEYRMTKVDNGLKEKLAKALTTPHEALHLPEKNEYIPTKFDLRPREETKVEKPRIVRDDKIARVWYLQDDEYKLPKAQVHIAFGLPKMAADPLNTVMSALYIMCFEDAISEEIYNPLLAGMKESVDITMRGLRLNFGGYDEKLHVFVADIMRKLVNFEADQHRFGLMMDRLVRNLKNFEHSQPYAHSQYYMNLLLAEKGWTKAQMLAMTELITLEMVNEFIPNVWKALHVELFVHGNLSEDEATALSDEILEVIHDKHTFVRPLFSNEMQNIREMKIDEGDSLIYEVSQPTHQNTAVDLIVQTGVQGTRPNMLLELLAQMAYEPAYTILRTQEQLGYIVHTGVRRTNGAQAFEVIVQGAYEPKYVEERIENFFVTLREKFANDSEQVFADNVQTLALRRLEKPKTLRALSNRYWYEIDSRQYSFDRAQIETAELKLISKEEFMKFYDDKILAGSPNRQKLSIRVHSLAKKEANVTAAVSESKEERGGRFIDDLERFKTTMSMYAFPSPAREVPVPGADSFKPTVKENNELP